MAILEAIDRDLDERGLVDKGGKPRYLLNHRWRVSKQLDHWLEKISAAIERQSTEGQEQPRAEFADYVRELQRIALGQAGARGSGSPRSGSCSIWRSGVQRATSRAPRKTTPRCTGAGRRYAEPIR
jgi:hypothetical protein